jgi:flagellar motility protein MotE (MotC chaperone)
MNHLYLYVALIGVVLVLFALTRNGKNASANLASPVVPQAVGQAMLEREVKATLDEFISDFERENAHLLQTFAQLRNDSDQQLQSQQELIQALEQRVAHLEAKVEEQAVQLVQTNASALHSQPEAATEAASEPTLLLEPLKPAFAFNEKYAKVVELSRQGRTTEQIARETEIGLGEIHFVLGLVKQEES